MGDLLDTARPAPTPAGLALVEALEARLGHLFLDRATALASLTHKSWVNEHRDEARGDNERLEFLGDAVIDLAVSHRLMERFPQAREGELSKMRAAVVDEAGLAALAALHRPRRAAPARARRGADRRPAEGLAAGRRHGGGGGGGLPGGRAGRRARAGRSVPRRGLRAGRRRHARPRLQDASSRSWPRAASGLAPRYRVVAELGPDHAKIFEVELDLRGEVVGRAQGRSKKDAEQAAARLGHRGAGGRAEAGPGPEPLAEGGAGAQAGVEPSEVEAPEASPAPPPGPEPTPPAGEAPAPRKRVRKAAPRVRKKAAAVKPRRTAAKASPGRAKG